MIGLASVMDTAPLYRSRDVSSILAVFAARAAAELERIRIEAALAASEERLAAAVSGSKDGLFDANLVTGEVSCSPRLYEIAGYAGHEEELDLSGDGLLSHLHKGDGEALALAKTPGHPIDLVVSDVVLPEISGPEVLRVLRQRAPRLKEILVSGYADQALVAEDALPPRTAFLPKPYSPAALAALVREVLDTPNP